MSLEQDVLQLAVHARRRLNEDRSGEEKRVNYELLVSLSEYAEHYGMGDAKFIKAMIRTYLEVPGQRSLFDVQHDGAKYLNNNPTKVSS
jgi:hypothetical protein